ncbi:D-alanine transaminase [Bacillus tianshenii]|uniref:D-alanine aminotransferase n=1 Tax=Sutcliffiella tianshenii TaxID=1463404 RepID=A0ABS2NX30_9BACI|nr:D-amino-acid transaminase [Bacillus tianshenii]MBM7619226.1 D-alanine transaminase [Bacillus tianshenii]
MKVLVDGEIVARSVVKVDMEDRGYQFGDGVYEVINIYDGVPFTLDEHIERLYRSAKEIGMSILFESDHLKQDIRKLIKENNMKKGGLYLQVTRGVAPRTHQYQKDISSKLIAYPLPYKEMAETRSSGVTAITEQDLRWLRCDIKSLNLLYNIMIKQKSYEQGAFEAILIRDGLVTEGTSSNVFIIKDGTIYTHPATNLILNGITRQKLLEVFLENGWTCKEQPFTTKELMEADEVFVTSTTSEVVPVISIDGKSINNGIPGSLTRKIQQAFSNTVKKETSSAVL